MTSGRRVLPPDLARPRRRRPRGRLAGVTAFVLGLVLSGPVASAAPVDSWPSADAGAGQARYNAGESVITPANAGRVQRAWAAQPASGMSAAPAVVSGVAYHVVGTGNVFKPGSFTATSVRTGATLWTVRLPVGVQYLDGVSVSGRRAVISFDGHDRPGGVLAVDLPTRRVAWTRSLPARRRPSRGWARRRSRPGRPPSTAPAST